jgi:hypothetical protein
MGAEKVLLVKYKMDKPSYDIESPTRDAIRRLGADDSNLAVITWGNETTGTNQYKDIKHTIFVGQLQAPLKEYIALQRGAAGTKDNEPFDMERAPKVRLYEVAAGFDQAVGRGAARKLRHGKCSEPVYLWTIFSQRGRMRLIRAALFRQYSSATVEDWHPLGLELAGGAKKSKNREPFFHQLQQHEGAWFEGNAFEPEFPKQMVRRYLTNDVPFLDYLAAQGLKVETKEGGQRRGGQVLLYRLITA